MSTIINARSPFYLTATAPTVSLGTFTCTTAGLSGFAVASDGTVTEPNILRGTIIDRSDTSFAAKNVGDLSQDRTVTYTIRVPDGYTNFSDSLACPLTATQTAPAAGSSGCVPSNNNKMATFTGTISNITNLTSTTINLGSFFTQQSGATFKKYEVIRYGDSAVDFSLSDSTSISSTLTISTSTDSVSATFIVQAHNNGDTCVTSSNSFTATSASTFALHCTTDDSSNRSVSVTGGNVAADGTVSRASFLRGNLTDIIIASIGGVSDGSTSVMTSLNFGANGTGSTRTVVLNYIFTVPQGYSNYGSGSTTLTCPISYNQIATSVTPTLDCANITFKGFRLANTGDIIFADGTAELNDGQFLTVVDVTTTSGDHKFAKVQVDTNQQLDIFVTIPSGYVDAGTIKECPAAITVKQPATFNTCDSSTLNAFITDQAFDNLKDFCNKQFGHTVKRQITGQAVVGALICENGRPFPGQNMFHGYSATLDNTGVGDIGGEWIGIRISEFGIVTEVTSKNCDGNTDFDLVD